MQQQWAASRLDSDVWRKVGFIWQLVITSSVAGQRKSSKALPKAKLAPKKGHGHCLVACCQSDHYSFLNPSKTITPEKYTQQISEMHWKRQRLQLRWSTERAQFFSTTTPNGVLHNRFKSWMNRAMKSCLICLIHLTSRQLTTTSTS